MTPSTTGIYFIRLEARFTQPRTQASARQAILDP